MILFIIKNFKGLEHRLEKVFENDKFLFINNSKATNLESSFKSLQIYQDIFLILGGRIKDKDFSTFIKVKKRVNKCFIIGESTDFIFDQVSNYFQSYKCYNLDEAIKQIFLKLIDFPKKTTILLSPGCSSFDQFKNFEERGNKFKKLIFEKIK